MVWEFYTGPNGKLKNKNNSQPNFLPSDIQGVFFVLHISLSLRINFAAYLRPFLACLRALINLMDLVYLLTEKVKET